jgi:hypothetical protein
LQEKAEEEHMQRRNKEEQPQPTAQPKSTREQLKGDRAEPGLSVSPDDLGRQFLRDATEQDNFESSLGEDTQDVSIVDGAPSDDALSGPSFDPNQSIWESTVDLSLESGGLDELREESSPEDNDQTEDLVDDEEEIDLGREYVRDGSLLDREAPELGETQAPDPMTDDHEARRLPTEHGKVRSDIRELRGAAKTKAPKKNTGGQRK